MSIQEKRRDMFEHHYGDSISNTWMDGTYFSFETRRLWEAWNTALDSICVELPSTEKMQGNELKVLYEVKAAMRAAGVQYK